MYRSGKRFMERLPAGKDILKSVEELCATHAVQIAVFCVIGAVRSATLGVFDQKQQVYVTRKEESPFEIISCLGNISTKDGNPVAHAKIMLADEKNLVLGGHLFSDTLLFYGELNLEEIEGSPLERQYDESSGLFLWPFNKLDTSFRST